MRFRGPIGFGRPGAAETIEQEPVAFDGQSYPILAVHAELAGWKVSLVEHLEPRYAKPPDHLEEPSLAEIPLVRFPYSVRRSPPFVELGDGVVEVRRRKERRPIDRTIGAWHDIGRALVPDLRVRPHADPAHSTGAARATALL